MSAPLVTCLKCGWVSFPVSRSYAEAQITRFNEYFDTLSTDEQQLYYHGRKSSLNGYTCQRCAGDTFRVAQPGECQDGCTLNPVIWEPTSAK